MNPPLPLRRPARGFAPPSLVPDDPTDDEVTRTYIDAGDTPARADRGVLSARVGASVRIAQRQAPQVTQALERSKNRSAT